MTLRNLNVFIGLSVLASINLASPLAAVLSIVFMPFFGHVAAIGNTYVLAIFLLCIALVIAWVRMGFTPTKIKLGRERRFDRGHKILAITNFIAAALVAGCAILWFVFDVNKEVPYAFGVMTGFVLAYTAWPIGLIMIWTSHA